MPFRSTPWRTSCRRSLGINGGASDCGSGTASAALGVEFDFVFPNAQDGPAFGLEQAVDLGIPCDVAADLRAPEFGIGLRRHTMRGARVPEAAVHKYSHPCGYEGEIRAARQPTAERVAKSGAPEEAAETHLDGCV